MKPVWKLILLLVITFIIIALYSFSSETLKLGNIEIKKSGIKEFIVGDTVPVPILGIYKHGNIQQPEMDSTKQKILLIGDSMLEQLRWRCRDYVIHNGHEMKSVIWYSAQSKWYGKSDTLTYYINQYDPTYIILVLGANELFVSDIIKKRNKYAKRIVQQMDTIPYIWVGPPNWKDDTGINEMIVRNVGKRRYFPSKNLKYRRYADGAHPKPESAAMWMDSIAVWIMNKSAYPIVLDEPDKKYKGSPNTTILQPWK